LGGVERNHQSEMLPTIAINNIRATIVILNAIFTVRFTILKTTNAIATKIRKNEAAIAKPTGVETIESGAISNKNISNFLLPRSFQFGLNLPQKAEKNCPELRILRQPKSQNQLICNVRSKMDGIHFRYIQ
jgi:hypothetical protein